MHSRRKLWQCGRDAATRVLYSNASFRSCLLSDRRMQHLTPDTEAAMQNKAQDASSSGVVDVPLPMDKLRYKSSNALRQVVLVSTGSFNPPTYMHLRLFELARDALRSFNQNVVGAYMSPVNDAYAKKGLAPAEHRIRLCELAATDSSYIMVDPWEAKQAGYQRTLTVLARIKDAVNVTENVGVMLLCGADLLESFKVPGLWEVDQVKAICQCYGIVCISRGQRNIKEFILHNEMLKEYKENIIVVDELVQNNISSTQIRDFFAQGLSAKYLTPDSVIEYIKQHHLYNVLDVDS